MLVWTGGLGAQDHLKGQLFLFSNRVAHGPTWDGKSDVAGSADCLSSAENLDFYVNYIGSHC